MNMDAFYVYLGIFISLLAAGVGVPIPEEAPILAAGVAVGQALNENGNGGPHLHWWIMLPVCILGIVVCDGMLYGFGRFLGPRILQMPWTKRLLSDERRRTIEENFHRYGLWVLLGARLLPTIRAPIFIMAGVTRIRFSKFVLADAIYAIPGVNLLFWLAFGLGNAFRDLFLTVEGKVAKAGPILLLIAIAVAGLYLLYHFLRHPVATGDPVQEIPVIGKQFAAKMSSPDSPSPIPHGESHPPENATPPEPVPQPSLNKDGQAPIQDPGASDEQSAVKGTSQDGQAPPSPNGDATSHESPPPATASKQPGPAPEGPKSVDK
jgi:membrane protein DedA with SNARE-associated domain